MIEKKFYTAKYDRVFKTIICDEDDKNIFQIFLSRTLKRKVEIVEFLKNELPIRNTVEKLKTVDVLAIVDGEYTHIEVNGSSPEYLHTRNFTYFAIIYSKKVRKGEQYDLITKFIHIDLTYGMKDNGEDYIEYYIQSNKGEKYLDTIKIIEFNMDRIMEYWYNKEKEKIEEYKHLVMLDLETTELDKLSMGDDFVKEFNEKLTKLNEDETFQSAMTYEEDQRLILNTEKSISFNQGVEQGIEQGSRNEKIEIAKKLKASNMSIEEISKITELPIQVINSLQ